MVLKILEEESEKGAIRKKKCLNGFLRGVRTKKKHCDVLLSRKLTKSGLLTMYYPQYQAYYNKIARHVKEQ